MPSADKAKLNTYPSAAPALLGLSYSTEDVGNTLVQRNSGGTINTANLGLRTGRIYCNGSTGNYIQQVGSGSNFQFSHAATGPGFNPVCDLDLKRNIEAVSDDQAALRDVLSAGQLTYDRVQDGIHALGFGAQALRDINPLWVVGGEELDPDGSPEDMDGAIVDGDGVTLRRPLAVDPIAMMSSVFAAIRQNANDAGYALTLLEKALNRIDALEAEMAALKAA